MAYVLTCTTCGEDSDVPDGVHAKKVLDAHRCFTTVRSLSRLVGKAAQFISTEGTSDVLSGEVLEVIPDGEYASVVVVVPGIEAEEEEWNWQPSDRVMLLPPIYPLSRKVEFWHFQVALYSGLHDSEFAIERVSTPGRDFARGCFEDFRFTTHNMALKDSPTGKRIRDAETRTHRYRVAWGSTILDKTFLYRVDLRFSEPTQPYLGDIIDLKQQITLPTLGFISNESIPLLLPLT